GRARAARTERPRPARRPPRETTLARNPETNPGVVRTTQPEEVEMAAAQAKQGGVDAATATTTEAAGRELVLTRTFDASRSLVFKAWTGPEHRAGWWGPHGFTNPVCEVDVRPGGGIRIDMRWPDGTIAPMRGTFHEVDEPERLVFTSTALEDERGNPRLE